MSLGASFIQLREETRTYVRHTHTHGQLTQCTLKLTLSGAAEMHNGYIFLGTHYVMWHEQKPRIWQL